MTDFNIKKLFQIKKVMPNVSVDLDIEDFLWSCSDRDIDNIITYLVDEEYLVGKAVLPKTVSLYDEDLNHMLNKISENKLRLTIEEEQIIKNIAKRF